MKKREFGRLDSGQIVYLFDIENNNGMKMTITNLGATLVNLWVPDKDGELRDVVLGYDKLDSYVENIRTYFGATIGRNANRIAEGFCIINNVEYPLYKNEGEKNHHSGPNGFQLRVWDMIEIDEVCNKITFQLISPDGDQGFPGKLYCKVSYELTNEGEIKITFVGNVDKDTIFNPTNHTYFNLNGHHAGSILHHTLNIQASMYTPVKEDLIPTGEFESVKNTPFDFLEDKELGLEIDIDNKQLKITNGYDHNFVLDKSKNELSYIGTLKGDKSKIKMDVSTNLPGVHLYTGNFLDNELGKEGCYYQKGDGVCLETQYFPNAINQNNFDSPILKGGESREYITVFSFSR